MFYTRADNYMLADVQMMTVPRKKKVCLLFHARRQPLSVNFSILDPDSPPELQRWSESHGFRSELAEFEVSFIIKSAVEEEMGRAAAIGLQEYFCASHSYAKR